MSVDDRPNRAGESQDDRDAALGLRGVQGMQIIAAGLIAGAAILLTVMVVIVQVGGPKAAPARGLPVVSLVAAVVALAALPLSFVLPPLQVRQALGPMVAERPDPAADGERLLAAWQAATLLGYGLTEGPTILASIAYLMEAHPLALGVAGVCIAVMVLRFPTEGRTRSQLARQVVALAELRERRDLAGER